MMEQATRFVQVFFRGFLGLLFRVFLNLGLLVALVGSFLAFPVHEIRADEAKTSLQLTIQNAHETNSWKIISVPIPKELFEQSPWLFRADTDGDGRDEILLKWTLTSGMTQLALRLDNTVSQQIINLPAGVGGYPVGAADLDGDLRDEFIWFRDDDSTLHVAKMQANGDILEASLLSLPTGDYQFPPQIAGWRCKEGKPRGILLWKSAPKGPKGEINPSAPRCLFWESDRKWVFQETLESGTTPDMYPLWPFDAEGIGTEDILYFGMGTGLLYMRKLEHEGPQPLTLWADFSPFLPFANWQGRISGDFDGDGRGDVVSFGNQLSDARIAYSRGKFALEQEFAWPFPIHIPDPAQILVGDFNVDGRSDLAKLSRDDSSI